jgi:voltage-gated potassium channel
VQERKKKLIFPFFLLARMRAVLRKNFARLAMFVVAVILYGTISEYLLERPAQGTGVKTPFDSLWFVMQTITTVGYGDTPVVSFWGRINAMALMVVGIGVLGFFSASFASLLIDYSSSRKLGERRVSMRNHIVLCNWNGIADELVTEILKERRDVVLLALLERTPDDALEFVKGTCLRAGDLQKASVGNAESVIVLSEVITDGEFASAIDAKAILGVMNARKLSSRAHVVVELLKSESVENARQAGANETVVRGQVSAKLLSRGALDPGTIDIVETMLTAKSGEEIFEERAPRWFVGKTYAELASMYVERRASPIALRSSSGLKINPSRDTVVAEGDAIVYISKTRVDAAKDRRK